MPNDHKAGRQGRQDAPERVIALGLDPGVVLYSRGGKGHRRARVRRAVTLRVDYATPDGRVWLGVVRNLSLQRMYIDSALRHVMHNVDPGTLLTVAFMLPSGRPCKLRALVIHSGRRGCGVQFLEGHPQSFAHLASYWSAAEKKQAL